MRADVDRAVVAVAAVANHTGVAIPGVRSASAERTTARPSRTQADIKHETTYFTIELC